MFVPFCRLQDVCPFVFKRGWYWEGLACVLVLCPDERTLRCHLVLAVYSSCDHAAPRPVRTRQSCSGEVPTRPKLVLLPEATVRNEYRHGLPSVYLQDGLRSAQDFVHEGQHNVHPDHCGIEKYVSQGHKKHCRRRSGGGRTTCTSVIAAKRTTTTGRSAGTYQLSRAVKSMHCPHGVNTHNQPLILVITGD